MKTIITTILLLFTVIVVGQVKEVEFDKVYLKAKKEDVIYTKAVETIARVYDETITIKNKDGLFIFTVKVVLRKDEKVVVLIVDSVAQENVKVVYDTNLSAISFDFEDRFIMFYDTKRINDMTLGNGK
jgi:hypothetical protein